VAWAEVYLHAKFHLDPSNRLATNTNAPDRDRQTDRQTQTDGLTAYSEPFYKWSTKKLKPGSVASYDIRPGNGEGLLWFRHFINVTYLLRHLLIYLQPGTITGRQTHDYRSDSMDFMTRPFLLSISFFCF